MKLNNNHHVEITVNHIYRHKGFSPQTLRYIAPHSGVNPIVDAGNLFCIKDSGIEAVIPDGWDAERYSIKLTVEYTNSNGAEVIEVIRGYSASDVNKNDDIADLIFHVDSVNVINAKQGTHIPYQVLNSFCGSPYAKLAPGTGACAARGYDILNTIQVSRTMIGLDNVVDLRNALGSGQGVYSDRINDHFNDLGATIEEVYRTCGGDIYNVASSLAAVSPYFRKLMGQVGAYAGGFYGFTIKNLEAVDPTALNNATIGQRIQRDITGSDTGMTNKNPVNVTEEELNFASILTQALVHQLEIVGVESVRLTMTDNDWETNNYQYINPELEADQACIDVDPLRPLFATYLPDGVTAVAFVVFKGGEVEVVFTRHDEMKHIRIPMFASGLFSFNVLPNIEAVRALSDMFEEHLNKHQA